jgi:hypothetical protein
MLGTAIWLLASGTKKPTYAPALCKQRLYVEIKSHQRLCNIGYLAAQFVLG